MAEKLMTPSDLMHLRDAINVVIVTWSNGLRDATAPGPVDPVPPPGKSWLSGVADGPTIIHDWAKFRGTATTYARTWADSDSNNMQNLYTLAAVKGTGYSGVLDLCVGGPSDWADAARGGYDLKWRGQCRKILELWGNLRRLDISMAHEFNNIPGYAWTVSGPEQADFRNAWARWYGIVQDELVRMGKNAKVVLSCNSDTNGGWTLKNGLPSISTFDYVGVDNYNFWPATPDQAAWDKTYDSFKGDVPRGIGAWIAFARKIGKPITVPEWGCAPGGNFPVDDPFYITMMNKTFASIAPADPYNPGAGELAGEAYFNAYLARGRLYPQNPSAPKVARVYLDLWGAKKA
jgi:hypothetical protein